MVGANFPHRYIVMEGCIGVGKTTLSHLVARHLGARVVLEVVEENPFLPLFYQDQVAHAFKTQMFFLLSRFRQQEAMGQDDLFTHGVVSDYLFAKDRIFAALTLNPSELALYDQVYHLLNARVPRPDLVIFLQAPMEIILQRIRRRGRSFEQDIDVGYLESLVRAYQQFFAHYTDTPLLVVDTEDFNFPERPADLQRVFDAASRVRRGSHRLSAAHSTLPLLGQ